MLNLKVHDSRKKKHQHLDKPQAFCNNVLWTDETSSRLPEVELFGQNAQHHVWSNPNTAFQQKCLVSTVSTVVEG